MLPLKTRSAAKAIGVSLPALRSALGSGKLAPPAKDESGDFIWWPEDIERAKSVMLHDRRRKYSESEVSRAQR
jgi:hypothetical protein